MRNRNRFSWVEWMLVIGHLAIIAGLGVSTLGDRPGRHPLVPTISILDSLFSENAKN